MRVNQTGCIGTVHGVGIMIRAGLDVLRKYCRDK